MSASLRSKRYGSRDKEMTMASAEMNRVFDNWAAAWASHDAEKVVGLFTDDCMFEDVTFELSVRGKEQLRGLVSAVFAAMPDVIFEVTGGVAGGDRAAVEWVMSGIHKGDLPGMPATGKRFSVRGTTILELQGGKISRESDYWDAVTLMKQVGLMKSEAQVA